MASMAECFTITEGGVAEPVIIHVAEMIDLQVLLRETCNTAVMIPG